MNATPHHTISYLFWRIASECIALVVEHERCNHQRSPAQRLRRLDLSSFPAPTLEPYDKDDTIGHIRRTDPHPEADGAPAKDL